MTEKDICDAYCRIRKIDHTIPDEVLDFMYYNALEKLKEINREEEYRKRMRNLNFCVIYGREATTKN